MELLDTLQRPLRDLRISVTDRCNFRCTYCMPREVFGPGYQFLNRTEILSYEEITRLARIFVSLGVEKLRITGGEPLVRKDLHQLLAQLRAIPGMRDLTLTTNGSLLRAQAQKLKDAGLQRITVSLDSLDDAVFQSLNDSGVPVATVLDGIKAAQEVGLAPIKVNAVVKRGVNDHTMVDLARHFRGTGVILRFIEFMDVGATNGWKLD
ncbi:MAG TPA: radical SAM protein, partial [Tepidiformaceae bacterium]|nr:radical SAM protein [Tepidiformaceae bacterium]